MSQWIKSNSFLLGLLGMVGLAWMAPEWGAKGGVLMSEITRRVAVFLIFLVQGLGLPTEELKRGLGQWRLHAFVLGWNYIGLPVLALSGVTLFREVIPAELAFGFIYLGILPTTITSAVFFTSAAKGDVAVSVFSTVASNLISVILVPLGVALFLLDGGGTEGALVTMLWKLCQLIVFPMALGQILRPALSRWIPRMKPWFKRVTTVSIFFVMYSTFCDGVKSAVWSELGWMAVALAMVGALGLLVIESVLVWWSSGWGGFPRPGRIAAFLCASQKSLATGVPMAVSIFGLGVGSAGVPEVSVIVLPLMCFHVFQLILAAKLADYFARGDRG